MTKDKIPFETVILSDQVKEQIAKDPEIAEMLKEFMSCLRQAQQGVNDGRYKTMEDGMEALTGSRPERIEGVVEGDTDDDIEIMSVESIGKPN